MTDELQLFELPDRYKFEPEPLSRAEQLRKMARRSDPQTSWEASQAVLPRIGGQKSKIVDLLEVEPQGLTVSEMCERLGLEKPSVSKRAGELVRSGYLRESGTRKSNTGCKATIYTLARQTS